MARSVSWLAAALMSPAVIAGIWVCPATYHGGSDRVYSGTGNAGRPKPPRRGSSQVPLRQAARPKLEALGLIDVERMCSSMPGSMAAL